jgi:hypothetical protein
MSNIKAQTLAIGYQGIDITILSNIYVFGVNYVLGQQNTTSINLPLLQSNGRKYDSSFHSSPISYHRQLALTSLPPPPNNTAEKTLSLQSKK